MTTTMLHLSCGHSVEMPADGPAAQHPEHGFFHCGREVRIEHVGIRPGSTVEVRGTGADASDGTPIRGLGRRAIVIWDRAPNGDYFVELGNYRVATFRPDQIKEVLP